ncbi:MAG: bifunctional glutamate N-acetyltransferase/amino-acid acetyltransferase ArgJ [Pirellulaceae bacterium]|nr:bifunctional glutamate N-acetyltransferase/amino-acid acetyltransferase ArgJ [Planctomycetales bacterium]
MTIHVPRGFRMSAVSCGIKQASGAKDVSLFVSDEPATAAGVYTTNLVVAAPVVLDRHRTPSSNIRAVVINSGNANACTGEQGMSDAEQMAELTAHAIGCQPEQVLVMSTGIIGHHLPMRKIAKGIGAATSALASHEDAFTAAAEGLMTTDTVRKMSSTEITVGGNVTRICGAAKGAGMIGPKMATMLSVVLTDARLSPQDAQEILARVADQTFNCISVEGHMSTNDSLLLLASGQAHAEILQGEGLQLFESELLSVCTELARAIANDGEGISHLIELHVRGCATRDDALAIAKTVANSALVKTAIAGNDPNWGRIVSAAGYAGVPFDPGKVALAINGTTLYDQGGPVAFDAADVSKQMKNNRDTLVELQFEDGDQEVRFWTCDLTAEYIHINADYHT